MIKFNHLQNKFNNLSNSFKFFPISSIAVIAAGFILANLALFSKYDENDFMLKFALFFGILCAVSMAFESFKSIKIRRIYRIALIIICAFLFYEVLPNLLSIGDKFKLGDQKYALQFGSIFIFLSLFAATLNIQTAIISSVKSFIVFVILAVIFGIFAVTIYALFDINMQRPYFAIMFLNLAFCVILFLSELNSPQQSPNARIFGIFYYGAFAYGTILWIYLILRVFGAIKPNGGIVNLIVWFGFVAICLFYLKGIKTKFDKFFAFLVFGLLPVSLWAIGVRISEYGLTPNRYFVIAFCIWLNLAFLFLILGRTHKIPFILFALIAVFCMFSPWNYLKQSIKSQLKIHQLAVQGSDLEKIRSVEAFLNYYDIKFEPKLDKIEYKTTKIIIETRGNLVIKDISGFAYHIDHNLFQNKEFTKDRLDFYLSPSEIKISDKNGSIFELDFSKHLKEQNGQRECNELYCYFNVKADEILLENEKIKAKIFINSGHTEYSHSKTAIDSGHTNVSYDFYFTVKK